MRHLMPNQQKSLNLSHEGRDVEFGVGAPVAGMVDVREYPEVVEIAVCLKCDEAADM